MRLASIRSTARLARGRIGALWIARLLLAMSAALFAGTGQAPVAHAQAVGSMSGAFELTDHNDGDRLKVVFVTVDPERDTPAHLRDYMASFDPRIVGLTGSEPQIAAAAKGWNAFYNRIPEDNGAYTIAHSAYVYLMSRDNRLVGTLGFQEAEAEQLTKLRKLLEIAAGTQR